MRRLYLAPPSKRFIGALGLLMALNLGLVLRAYQASDLEETRLPRISPRADGIIVSGTNSLGLNEVKMVANWFELEKYLAERQLSLPIIRQTENAPAQKIEIRQDSSGFAYRVVWVQEGQGAVVFTPDLMTANFFAEVLRYSEIKPSPFGFSVLLSENEGPWPSQFVLRQ